MAILSVENLTKSFGALELFRDLSFVINKGQKVGLIAPNGSGKTTLMRIIMGEETADLGTIATQKDVRISYLPQSSDFSAYPDILSASISGVRSEIRDAILSYEHAVRGGDADDITHAMDRIDAVGGWQIEQELTALLSRLNITDPMATTKGLSGGQSKRIALASVLLGDPDFLILDEPTNHLDPDVIEWLEEYLSSHPVTLLMVTHDRYFLDQVCDTIYEIDGGTLYTYEGNYSLYLEKREARLEQMRSEQQSLRNIYRRELEWMRSTPQARSSKAKYRKDAFHETEARLKQVSNTSGPRLESGSVYIGKKIFEARGLSRSFDGKTIIRDFTYDFARHDRVGIIGPNGAGKTTLIRLIMGLLEPTAGTISVGETVQFGYFCQQAPDFPTDKKVIDVITDKAEKITMPDGHSITAMQFLNHFLFPPGRQQDFVNKLSGGERRRLQLCALLMENPNFLVLDEPTNDLDIPTLQVLEEYLMNFDGCLLIVSHDRYFMDRLTDHLFVLEGNGVVQDFPGNYTDYRLVTREKAKAVSSKSTSTKASSKPPRYRTPQAKVKRSYKEEREYQMLSNRIPEIEQELRTIEEIMSAPALSPDELIKMSEKYSCLKDELEEGEMRWLELSEIE